MTQSPGRKKLNRREHIGILLQNLVHNASENINYLIIKMCNISITFFFLLSLLVILKSQILFSTLKKL